MAIPLEIEAVVALHTGHFDQAEELFKKDYALYLKIQSEEKRPVHKGTPLYNLGLAVIAQGPSKFEEGLHYVLLAYVEDVLSCPYGEEDDADRAPAAQFLRDILQIQLSLLREIKSHAAKAKSDGLWGLQFDPTSLLKVTVEALRIPFDGLRSLCRVKEFHRGQVPVGFPQPWEMRVFIGGNYDTHAPVILEIKGEVVRSGYTPVIAFETAIPSHLVYHHSLMLLHTCRLAIFEISSPAGQLIEIERARDYGTIVLLVRSAIDPQLPPRVSGMITTAGFRIEYYRDIPDLRQIVGQFLVQSSV
jgi:hypothetical protein